MLNLAFSIRNRLFSASTSLTTLCLVKSWPSWACFTQLAMVFDEIDSLRAVSAIPSPSSLAMLAAWFLNSRVYRAFGNLAMSHARIRRTDGRIPRRSGKRVLYEHEGQQGAAYHLEDKLHYGLVIFEMYYTVVVIIEDYVSTQFPSHLKRLQSVFFARNNSDSTEGTEQCMTSAISSYDNPS